ncbi:tautomerase family protein [Thiohalorhabdus methylotrophus]|uniref:4-oxalocrotonate tautomerase family protein n=1 Tax=Thiohalorhabdus methylotrophus TaxID=3242694 RepID=A0ABV4TZZ3_9GAMM
MPTVRLTVPQNDLSKADKEEMVERLTQTVSTFFQERKQEDVRNFVMVQISETAESGYALGGEIIG